MVQIKLDYKDTSIEIEADDEKSAKRILNKRKKEIDITKLKDDQNLNRAYIDADANLGRLVHFVANNSNLYIPNTIEHYTHCITKSIGTVR